MADCLAQERHLHRAWLQWLRQAHREFLLCALVSCIPPSQETPQGASALSVPTGFVGVLQGEVAPPATA